MAKLTDKDPLAQIKADFPSSFNRMAADLERVSQMDGADPEEVERLRGKIEKLKREYGLK